MSPVIGRPRLAALLAASALSLAPCLAVAQTAPPLSALLAQARQNAPRLAEAQASVRQAEGLARQAGARPNPVLGVEVENALGSGPYDGFDAAETTASISQTFELGGKRPARVAAARATVTAAEARAGLAWNDLAARLIVAYAEAEAASARVTQAEEILAAAEIDTRAARELVAAGREAELRGFQAAAELEGARATVEEARAARAQAFARLSALAGSTEVFDGLSESILKRPAAGFALAAEGPALAAARADREAAGLRVESERVRARPDITVSAGVRRFSENDATALLAGVSVPLPIFDRNRGATDAARAELAGAEARLRQAQLDATADLRSAQAQIRGAAARAEASRLAEDAASEAYRLARLGYEAGRLPQLELTTARRGLAAARQQTLDANLSRVRAEAEVARLTGTIPFGGQDGAQ